MKRAVLRVLAVAVLVSSLVLPVACQGIQTQKGEPEPGSSTTATNAPASGSEEQQPSAGEEQTGGEQPSAPATP